MIPWGMPPWETKVPEKRKSYSASGNAFVARTVTLRS